MWQTCKKKKVIVVSELSTLWELRHWLTYSLWISRALFWEWQWESLIMRLNFTWKPGDSRKLNCTMIYLPQGHREQVDLRDEQQGKACFSLPDREQESKLCPMHFSFSALALLRQGRHVEICHLLVACKLLLMCFADVAPECSELHISAEHQWSQEVLHKCGSTLCRDLSL